MGSKYNDPQENQKYTSDRESSDYRTVYKLSLQNTNAATRGHKIYQKIMLKATITLISLSLLYLKQTISCWNSFALS